MLTEEREQLAVLEAQARLEVVQARGQTDEAVAARQVAETRLGDLEQLLTQRQAQIDDLQQQRRGLQQSHTELQAQVQLAQQSLQALQQQSEQERAAQELYVRGIEERAYREVDRAREEGKSRQAELRELKRQLTETRQMLEGSHTALAECQREASAQQTRAELAAEQVAREQEALQVRAETAQRLLAEAQRSAIAQQARADTLEAQLDQLRDTLQSKHPRKRT